MKQWNETKTTHLDEMKGTVWLCITHRREILQVFKWRFCFFISLVKKNYDMAMQLIYMGTEHEILKYNWTAHLRDVVGKLNHTNISDNTMKHNESTSMYTYI